MHGLKGMLRAWGPGLVLVSGSFQVSGGAVVNSTANPIRPSKNGFALTRAATGVFQVTLTQAFQSIVFAEAGIQPLAPAALTNISGLITSQEALITSEFCSVTATQFVKDTTNTKVGLFTYPSGSLGDPANTYRVVFNLLLAEMAMNK